MPKAIIDIDAMTTSEWLNYRDDLLEDFYKRGHVLKPNPDCTHGCDPDNDYTCFACECFQLNEAEEND